MTKVYEILKTAEDGTILDVSSKRTWMIPVTSTEIIPKDCPIYSQAYIVDKAAVAVCDGKNNWYMEADKPVMAGQTWAAFFS